MNGPKVTVLMPVFNGVTYLKEAIESILNQTFNDFEFLIIDDGSTDGTRDLLCSYKDPRINLLYNKTNIGLAKTLNCGLEIAKGKYIARMDGDDISMRNRLDRQIDFLENHSDVVLLGSWALAIDENGKELKYICPPENSYLLRWNLLFQNHLVHSTIVYRKKFVKQLGGYLTPFAEDYDLWSRIIMEHMISLVPEILVYWREHSKGFNTEFLEKQQAAVDRIVLRNFQTILGEPVPFQVARDLPAVLRFESISSASALKNCSDILESLFHKVLLLWNPDLNVNRLIGYDYAKKMISIASLNCNFLRKGSLTLIRKSIFANRKILLNSSIWICFFKLILGPRLAKKFSILRSWYFRKSK